MDRGEAGGGEEIPPKRRERILTVEDDYLVRLHVSAMLKRLGYRVSETSNGQEALAMLQEEEIFSLRFTDFCCPQALMAGNWRKKPAG